MLNRDPNLYFGLFSDFTDAPEATVAADAEVLAAIRAVIDDLNKRYQGERFLPFHRNRVWSETHKPGLDESVSAAKSKISIYIYAARGQLKSSSAVSFFCRALRHHARR